MTTTITSNKSNARQGIYLKSFTNTTVTNNTVKGHLTGIYIESGKDLKIVSNTINNSLEFGVRVLGNASNVSLESNIINASNNASFSFNDGAKITSFIKNQIKNSGANALNIADTGTSVKIIEDNKFTSIKGNAINQVNTSTIDSIKNNTFNTVSSQAIKVNGKVTKVLNNNFTNINGIGILLSEKNSFIDRKSVV